MSMLDPKAKALIFDVDGTLVDSMPLHFVAWMKVSKEFGLPFDHDTFLALAGMPALQIIQLLIERHGLNLDPEKVAARKEAGFVELIAQARPVEAVAQVVRQCHGKLPMALGTGGTREVAWKSLQAAGLAQYFEIMVSAEDVIHHKPAPDTFLECARRMGVEPRHCQVFEDADKGIEAAIRAGMIPCDIRDHLAGRNAS